jgi:beta-galactosidase
VTNAKGIGLMAVGMPLIESSALHHSVDDLDSGEDKDKTHAHPTDMPKRAETFVNIDYKQMGLGGDTSWGARTHKEYTLPAGEYSYSFTLKPVDTHDGRLMQISKNIIL